MLRITSLLLITAIASPCLADEGAKEKSAEKKITFDEHIKPIFREHCTACHSESDKESDLALDSFGATLTGGSSGEVIAEGNADGSRLFALITHAERPYMPPDQDVIDKAQVQLIKTWIEQGMPENAGSKIKRSSAAAAAMLGNVSTGKPDGPPPMPASLLRQPVVTTKRSAAISAIAASPWAPLVAIGGQQQVSLYHSETGELLAVVPFPEGEPQSLTFTRDGKQLLIGGGQHSHSGCAVLIDIETGNRITKVGDELDIVLASDISPDKSRIAIAGPQKVIRVFDSLSGEVILELKKHTDWIFALRYSPDGILLASGDRSSGLVVWEAETGTLYADYSGHKGAVRSLDFRPDSNVLASASLDGNVKLWDLLENKEIKSWAAHPGGATSVAFSQTGLLASSGRDSKVKLWNADGSLKKEFAGLAESALEVAITGAAEHVIGGDWNGRVQIWKSENPAETKLVAANPPSIQQRLQDASVETEQLHKELLTAEGLLQAKSKEQEAAQLATEKAKTASVEIKAARKAAEGEVATLAATLSSVDAEIVQLKERLAAAEAKRNRISTEMTSAKSQLENLTSQDVQASKVLQDSAAASKLAHEAMTALQEKAKQAKVLWEQANSKLAQAQADQRALELRATELEKEAAERAKKVADVQQQLDAAAAASSTVGKSLENRTTELQSLRSKLAALQQQIEQAAGLQAETKAKAMAAEQLAKQLAAALESQAQAKVETEEELELFRQSYRKPQ